jgi:hypothetical protein
MLTPISPATQPWARSFSAARPWWLMLADSEGRSCTRRLKLRLEMICCLAGATSSSARQAAVELGHRAFHHHIELALDMARVGLFRVQSTVDIHQGQLFGNASANPPHFTHREFGQQPVGLARVQPVPFKHAVPLRPLLGHVVGQLGQRLAAAHTHTGGNTQPLPHRLADAVAVAVQVRMPVTSRKHSSML